MNHLRGALLLLPLMLAGCEPFKAWTEFGGQDSRLQFVGRMQRVEDEGVRYAYPGSMVRFRCHCTDVDLAFESEGKGGDKHTDFINVFVDGEHVSTLELDKESRLLSAARDLPPGEHLIEAVKRTGPYAGTIKFVGLALVGNLLDPPPLPSRRIEVLGDSISCGYGNEARIAAPKNTEPNTGYHSRNEDNSKSYGALLGRHFDAQVVTTCMMGRGVLRNPDGSTENTFPSRYTRLFSEQADSKDEAENKANIWDTRAYVPDLIISQLGNIDFTVPDEGKLPTAPDPVLFKAAYAKFVRELRQRYPSATILCTVGPTMTDYYPKDRKHWTLIQQYVREMVHELGDPKVHAFAHLPSPGDFYGEDWHPTADLHQRMSKELITVIERSTSLGW
ncbi:MAG: GDSL-type esterase/lipase family protein [Cystobacter sp.]